MSKKADLKGAGCAGHREGRHARQTQSACRPGNSYSKTGDGERVADDNAARCRKCCRHNDVRQWGSEFEKCNIGCGTARRVACSVETRMACNRAYGDWHARLIRLDGVVDLADHAVRLAVSTRSRDSAVPVQRLSRVSTIITIGRAAHPAAGGALPVRARAGAPNINKTMTERTRGMPAKDGV